jgi:hypothetical protein
MPRTKYREERIADLSEKKKQAMYALFEQYYIDVSYQQFLDDLKEKNYILMLYSKKNQVIGFSTILFKKLKNTVGREYWALFSGDTVVDKEYWGNKALQKAFYFFILKAKMKALNTPVYWFLQSKGFKTYLLMRKNFKQSYPNIYQDMPHEFASVAQHFYRMKYGDCYIPAKNQIIFPTSKGAAKLEVCEPKGEHLKDPEVQFFLAANPHYAKGVELACVGEITVQDLLGHVQKYFLKVKLPKMAPNQEKISNQSRI